MLNHKIGPSTSRSDPHLDLLGNALHASSHVTGQRTVGHRLVFTRWRSPPS